MHPLVQNVYDFIREHAMIARGERVLVGVSGGPDSLALLHILVQLQARIECALHVAHLDHQFRGEDSAAEARFVAAEAEKLGIPFTVESIDVPARLEDASVEAGAREIRYDFYERIASHVHAQRIALGHNADDQVETILMRFLRGTGLTGLAGIPAKRGKYIRPLLRTPRAQIEQFLDEHHFTPCQDPSNREPIYLRNKIRLELLPWLQQEYNPNIQAALMRLADLAATDNELLESLASERLAHYLLESTERSVELRVDTFAEEPTASQRRIIRQAIALVHPHLVDVGYEHIEAILGLIRGDRPNARLDLPGGTAVIREYDRLRLQKRDGNAEQTDDFEILLKIPGKTPLPSGVMIAEMVDTWETLPKSRWEVWIDHSALSEVTVVRSRRAGDRFRPFGMSGTQKLKDFLISQKIPRSERDRIPLVVSGERILWVVGYRLAEECRVTRQTRCVTRLRYLRQ